MKQAVDLPVVHVVGVDHFSIGGKALGKQLLVGLHASLPCVRNWPDQQYSHGICTRKTWGGLGILFGEGPGGWFAAAHVNEDWISVAL